LVWFGLVWFGLVWFGFFNATMELHFPFSEKRYMQHFLIKFRNKLS